MPTLIYLYGPPAAGKLTVAERLSALTGWAIFHGRCDHTVGVAGQNWEPKNPPYISTRSRCRKVNL